MGCGGLEPYSRTDVERTVLVRLHEKEFTIFGILGESEAMIVYHVVLWHQGGFNWS